MERVTTRVVLCFGDSNTWGFDPADGQRFPKDVRWTGVLQRLLGPEYRVVEEGLNGRTTVFDDPLNPGKNGSAYLQPCLESQAPVDLVVLMLGTNDLQTRFSLSPRDIAQGAAVLLRTIARSGCGPEQGSPPVLLLTPPAIEELPENAESFAAGGQRSKELARQYRLVAEELGCHFLDTTQLVSSSDLDGIHLDARAHQTLGQQLAGVIREILAA